MRNAYEVFPLNPFSAGAQRFFYRSHVFADGKRIRAFDKEVFFLCESDFLLKLDHWNRQGCSPNLGDMVYHYHSITEAEYKASIKQK